MTGFNLFLVVLQGVIFLVWAVLMFRSLFGILGRYRARTGRAWIGPIAVWREYGRFLTQPETRTERRRLGLLTLLLIVATVALAVLRSP